MTASTEAGEGMTMRERGTLLVLCGAIFLEGIDVAMINMALPAIRAELGLGTTTLGGVVSAYVLGYGGFMLLGGRAADLFGKRRVFLLALAVFIAFSGLGGLATQGWMLLASRFVTGVAAAFMTPAGLALVTTTFPEGPRRNKAVLIYAGTASAGFSLGLVAGGFLADIGWRWVFFGPVIFATLILAATPRLVPPDRAREASGPFDLVGATLLTGAMLAAAYGVTRIESLADGWAPAAAGVAAAGMLLAAFVARQRRIAPPLVRLGILRSAGLARANLGAGLFAGAFFGFTFLVTLFLQELRGWSAVQTGLALLAVSIDAVLAPTLTPWMVRRLGAGRVIFLGYAFALAAYVLFLPLDPTWGYVAMLPTMILLGIGFAFAYGPLTIVATNGVAAEEQGLASALVNTSFQFGAAMGLSAASAVSVLALAGDTPAERLEAMRLALLVPVAAVAIAAVVLLLPRPRPGDCDAGRCSAERAGA